MAGNVLTYTLRCGRKGKIIIGEKVPAEGICRISFYERDARLLELGVNQLNLAFKLGDIILDALYLAVKVAEHRLAGL